MDVLLTIIDDAGNDVVAWGDHAGRKAVTPFISSKLGEAAIFPITTMPECKPTRASILTGQFPCHHGVLSNDHDFELNGTMCMYHELQLVDWRAVHVGKWHLDGEDLGSHPVFVGGAEKFVGTASNLDSHYSWREYFCVRNRDRSIDTKDYSISAYSLDRQSYVASNEIVNGAGRNTLYVYAPNAPHGAWDQPPTGTYSTDGSTAYRHFLQAIEAFDYFYTRLHDLNPLGLKFMLADNGTPFGFSAYPPDERKGSVGSGGINSTLLVWGPGVVPGHRPYLTNVVDIRPTMREIAGLNGMAPKDGKSFAPGIYDSAWRPQRKWSFSEIHPSTQPHQRMCRTMEWKLRQIIESSGTITEAWHDLSAVVGEDGPEVSESAVPPDVVTLLRAKIDQQ